MPRTVLGLNAFHGDAAACLLVDGRVVMAVEEERLNRVKHCAGFPTQAVALCMAAGGIGVDRLDAIAISRQPAANLHKKVLYSLGRIAKGGGGRISLAIKDRLSNAAQITDLPAALAQALGCSALDLPRVQRVEHHMAHLASAFYASGFNDAALMTIDGFGDFVSTKLGRGDASGIGVFAQVDFPHSAGILYTAATQFLGFPHYGDEGKVMGLAAYGQPTFARELDTILARTDSGFRLDLDYFLHHSAGVAMTWDEGSPTIGRIYSDLWSEMFGAPRAPGAPLTDRDRNLAASVQHALDQLYAHLLAILHQKTQTPRLCLAGGVAYNSVANGKIRKISPFEEVYIIAAAGDSGTAIGAAYTAHLAAAEAAPIPPLAGAYLGPSYSADECAAALAARGIVFERLAQDELLARTAAHIAAGKVVGFFHGAMEFGPRALGHRSIVADPRRGEMKDILNARIKHRESFRPFAPSVLEEEVGEWFGDHHPSPEMLMVYDVRPERRALVPAITHVDGTARVQTVSARVTPRYHALIARFAAITGVPMVLNTSFNENEPIVATPADAIACYLKTGMDVLVLEDCLVERAPEPRA